jgi:4a-hydroxytetrahydrobiopterin dehydratase
MTSLSQRNCEACTPESKALSAEQCTTLLRQLSGWQLTSTTGVAQLSKSFLFSNFRQALAFSNQIGAISEEQNHHPALLTEWGQVTVNWWTHTLSGLHHNDFIMAARTDALALDAQGLKNG